MIDLKRQVKAALEGVCASVVYGDPRDFARQELVSWRESENCRYAQADGREYLAELRYALEIYAPGAEAAGNLLAEVDDRMCALGLCRESAVEQFEQDFDVSHISARYRALADAAGNVYQ